MNTRKLLLSTLCAGLTMWIVAGIWHSLIMAQFYADAGRGEHQGVGLMLLSYGILASMMAFLYQRRDSHPRPLVEGLLFGALIGLLWVFPHGLVMAAAHGEPLGYVFKNAGWHVVEQGLGGIVVGLIYGKA